MKSMQKIIEKAKAKALEMNSRGNMTKWTDLLLGAFFALIITIIIFTLLKDSSVIQAFFNWTALATFSPLLASIMPFLALFIVIVLVMAIVYVIVQQSTNKGGRR